jgi:hypothetical protein
MARDIGHELAGGPVVATHLCAYPGSKPEIQAAERSESNDRLIAAIFGELRQNLIQDDAGRAFGGRRVIMRVKIVSSFAQQRAHLGTRFYSRGTRQGLM